MNTVSTIVDSVGDTFTGFFGGNFSSMSTGKKVVIGVATAVVVAIVLFVIYKMFFSSGFGVGTRRVTGPAGCCGRLQGNRVQSLEAMISDHDMAESDADYARIGEQKISAGFNGLGFDNFRDHFDFQQGFTSPSAKPDAGYDTPMVDHLTGTGGMVTQQVPTLPYQRPALGEADFINMAYNA